MTYLLILIAAGFLIARLKIIPTSAAGILSKLENILLIPAFMLGTFMRQFTVETLSQTGPLLLGSLAVEFDSVFAHGCVAGLGWNY